MEKDKEKKAVEEPKKINNLTTNKFTNLNINKKEEKPKEKEKEDLPKKSNLISERLKMMQGGNSDSKKQDKPQIKPNESNNNKTKEDISKNNIKPFGAFNNLKKTEKEPLKKEPKRISNFQDKINKTNNIGTIKKEDSAKPNNAFNRLGSGFADRLKQMNVLFKNQGKDPDKRRGHSVMVTSKMGIDRGNWRNAGSNNLGIIHEEPDKMKPGYDPSANLQKRLDAIVVTKNKRKKTIAAFKG